MKLISKNLNNNSKVYQQDREFFKKIADIRQKAYIDNMSNKLNEWYKINGNDVEYLFNKIMNACYSEEIIFNTDTKEIYNDFVSFIFNYSNTTI